MNSFVSPFIRPRSGAIFAHAAAIKTWARRVLELDEKVVVSVAEIACAKPGCPPQETIILVLLAENAVKLSIHKALADVVEADVIEAARDGEDLRLSLATMS